MNPHEQEQIEALKVQLAELTARVAALEAKPVPVPAPPVQVAPASKARPITPTAPVKRPARPAPRRKP